ncbi:MAG: SDR family oxidoreductase [Nitrospira sp.]|nr:SDR family oxidoreductase [Nitrospira sp.]
MTKNIYTGKVVTLNIDTVTLPNGATIDLETIRHPGAAAVVPIKDDGTVVLIRQFRHAAGGFIYEIPAGKLQPGEDPLHCASRELEEEVGYRASSFELLSSIFTAPERVVPHYNVMGVAKAALECTVRYLAYDLGPKNIRVNAISAGPIKTLAARGVSGITKMVDLHKEFAPLRRATEQGEVGDTALFLVSSLGRGITGETIYVDGGFNILGMMAPGESPVS